MGMRICSEKVKKNLFLVEQFKGICSLMSENNNNIRRNAKMTNEKIAFFENCCSIKFINYFNIY